MLNSMWTSFQYSIKTKLRLYLSWVLSTLLYSSECWRMTESDLNKLSSFHTKNLRRIMQIFWPKTIFNQHLLTCYNLDSMGTIIMWKQWRWIGHEMRREPGNISHTALHWTPPQRKQKWGRPKNTWHRTVERALKTLHHTWGTAQKLAQNRPEWGTCIFVASLHASRHKSHDWASECSTR